jgi:hypothetical protein
MTMPNAVPDAILDGSRAMAARRFDKTGQIIPTILTPDSSGGHVASDGLPINFAFGLAQGNLNSAALEQRLLDRIANRPYFVVVCEHGLTIHEDDEIQMLTPEIRRFSVLGIVNAGVTYETVRRVVVVER